MLNSLYIFLVFTAPIGLPRFRRALDSFAAVLINCHTRTSIFAGVLAAGM
jgi:hypothetical protein